ncbi:MAG: DCC1-like thiol-disulfide oxidoreductase family protein [Litoreibacter sp.]
MTMLEDRPIWLFDSLCVLCDSAVHYTLKHERTAAIRFVSIQSPQGRDLARQHDIDPDNAQTFLFIEDGRVHKKSDGVIALVRHLGGPARLIRLTRFLPQGIRDLFYSWIARNRYRLLGKKDVCSAPDPQHSHRFTL